MLDLVFTRVNQTHGDAVMRQIKETLAIDNFKPYHKLDYNFVDFARHSGLCKFSTPTDCILAPKLIILHDIMKCH